MNHLYKQTPEIPKTLTLKHKLKTCAALSLGLWAAYLVERYTNFRFLNGCHQPMAIAIPLCATPILLIGAYWSGKTSTSFYNNSVSMEARIVNIGMTFRGWRDVTVNYLIGNQVYTKKISILATETATLRVGSSLPILVDQRKPKTAMADPNLFHSIV